MWARIAAALVIWTLLLGLAAIIGSPASAHGPGEAHQTAAQRCFERHSFGAQPVDVAKTADGQTVLAQTEWNWHDSIGCYLTLDNSAVTTLRAAPPPQSLPEGATDASGRCFERHHFGAQPVDVAKTADGQSVLARLIWNWHDSIGCYLTLDDAALTTLRAAHSTDGDITDPEPDDPDGANTRQFVPTIVAASNHYSLAVGDLHSCALKTDQTIACWGNNSHGQANAPAGRYTAVAVGFSHSCGIRDDQTIACWGSDNKESLWVPLGRYTAIDIGDRHSCALKTDQAIACWGDNTYGQMDAPAGRYTAVAAGAYHTCAIRDDQTLACWGADYFGAADPPAGRYTAISADGNCAIRDDQTVACWGDDCALVPASMTVTNCADRAGAPAGRYTAIAASGSHWCAIKTDQTIACWGNNSATEAPVPGQPTRWFTAGQADAPAGRYTAVALGFSHSCAIRDDQTIACWGDYRQADPPAGRYTAIAANGASMCAINTGGAIACWGDNEFGQAESPDSSYAAVAAGADHMCAIKIDGSAVCSWASWYRPRFKLQPRGVLPAGQYQYTAISAGDDHSCAIRADQTIACWGQNDFGQADPPAGRHTAISAGDDHSCAIRADQAIACWGDNDSGQTDPPAGRHTAISAGDDHSCAIRADQTIACWGDNDSGQTDPPAGRHTAVYSGMAHSCALRADQTIACWGDNEFGYADTPSGQFTAVAAGAYHTCAIRADQTIACWGNNQDGQTDAPAGRYTAVAAGWFHTCAIGVDTTMTCWGDGGFGPIDHRSDLRRISRGDVTVVVHICTAPELRPTIPARFLDDAVRSLNEQLAPIYRWESSGQLNLRFEAGQTRETSFMDREAFACDTQEQEGERWLRPRSVSNRHFLHYTGAECFDFGTITFGCFGGVGAFSGKSASIVNPREGLLAGLQDREYRTIQHELDHALLRLDHFYGSGLGQTRALSGDTDHQTLGRSDPVVNRDRFRDSLACYDRDHLGWPTGRSSPVCTLLPLRAPQDVSAHETADGNIVLRWSTTDHVHWFFDRSPRLPTGYKIVVSSAEEGSNPVIATLEVSDYRVVDGAAQLQLPRLAPSENRHYLIDIYTVSSDGTSPTSNWLLMSTKPGADAASAHGGPLAAPAGDPAAISAGESATCVIKADKTIACLSYFVLGGPGDDPPAGEFTAVSAEAHYSCGIRTDRTAVCWGSSAAIAHFGSAGAPAGEFTAISVDGDNWCAIRADKTIACWGLMWAGPPAGEFTAISAGEFHSCAIRADKTIACWGENNAYGQLDAPAGEFTAISAGNGHSCAIRADKTIACWGLMRAGPPAGEFTAVSAGNGHSCAIRAGKTIACWGENNAHGQLDAPAGEFTAVTAGGSYSCAIRADKTAVCWGFGPDLSNSTWSIPR